MIPSGPGLDAVALTSLAPGAVAQVLRIGSTIDTSVSSTLARSGLIAGTRVSVAAVAHDGAITVRASRDVVALPAPVAASILVVPGDLATISDRIARRHDRQTNDLRETP